MIYKNKGAEAPLSECQRTPKPSKHGLNKKGLPCVRGAVKNLFDF